jgi:hypothetical protein
MNDTKDKPKTSDKTKAKAKPKPVSKKELENFVSEQVMSKLGGRPSKFHSIRSKNVFDNKWRVDIFCYVETATENAVYLDKRIDYSFFVSTDDSGKIIKSDPKISTQSKI